MKNKVIGILTGILIATAVSADSNINSNGSGSISLEPDQKLGQVGGEEFTVRDWNREYEALEPNIRAEGVDKLFLPLRKAIIEKIALSNEAIKQGMDKSKEYQAALKKAKRDILTKLYLAKNTVAITEADLKKEYDALVAKMGDKQQVKARHILVKKRSEAEKIIKALQSGSVDFPTIAKSKSIGPSGKKGGDLGWVSAGQMVPEFEKALFDLKDGEISKKAVKTQFGWHIIKREESRKQQPPKFEDAKRYLMANLRQQQAQKLIDEAIKQNKVVVFDEKGKEIK